MQPIQQIQHHSHRRLAPTRVDPRRRRIQHSIWWGRLWLALTFFALLATYFAAVKYMPMHIPPVAQTKARMMAGCGLAILWEAALVAAIWMRNNWARLIFIGLLMSVVVSFAAIVPILFLRRPRVPVPLVEKIEMATGIHLAAAVMLIACKPIKKLTNRSYQ